jgi:hypothetical protein
MVSTFILICPSRLLRTFFLLQLTLPPEHKVALLMKCVGSITDVLFPEISLISYAIDINYL